MHKLFAFGLLILSGIWAPFARGADSAEMVISTIQPLREDVDTIDGIVKAFYRAVQVLPHEKRLWSRDRTLYSPWVRFVFQDKDGNPTSWTHQQLVEATEPLVQSGFQEKEIHRVLTQYGSVAHVYSTYHGVVAGDPALQFRGVNSMQLFHDGERWWITGVAWQSETDKHPIPDWLLGIGSVTVNVEER